MRDSIFIAPGVCIAADSINYYCIPDSAPLRQKLKLAAERNELTDLTFGKKTRTLIFLKNREIIKSPVHFETIDNRFNER